MQSQILALGNHVMLMLTAQDRECQILTLHVPVDFPTQEMDSSVHVNRISLYV